MQDSIFIAHELFTAIAEVIPERIDFLLYPNPAAEKINIALESFDLENRNCKVDIIDLYGRTIQSQDFDITGVNDVLTLALNQSMSSGVYSIRVWSGTNSTAYKFIKLGQ